MDADKLKALHEQIQLRHEGLITALKVMNSAWAAAPAVGSLRRAEALPLGSLEEIYRAVSFLTRWSGQLQERIVQLSL